LFSLRAMKHVSHKTGCHLRALYLKEGFQVLYCPYQIQCAAKDALEQAVHNTIAYAQAGQHIVIHCSRVVVFQMS